PVSGHEQTGKGRAIRPAPMNGARTAPAKRLAPERKALAAAAALSLLSAGAVAQTSADGAAAPGAVAAGDWTTINGDPAATRYSPLDQINRDNVSRLEEAWTYRLNGASTAVPLVVDGVMYLPSGDRVVALDGDSGDEIWVHVLSAPQGPRGEGAASASPVPMRAGRASTRGVAWWP